MDINLSKPRCIHCDSPNTKLRRQIIVDGTSQVAWRCVKCDRWAENPPKWIRHEDANKLLRQWCAEIDDLPIVEDHSDRQLCIICGEPGQNHHFAPKVLAEAFGGDWGKWPEVNLCLKHHRLWHDTVTSGLHRSSKE